MRLRSILAIFITLSFAVFTMGMTSVPTNTTFTCNGLKLQDNYNSMLKTFGSPWYSDDRFVYGRAVKYYIYHDNTQIGIAKKTGKIVDIIISDRKYQLNNNIRLGATPYKMQSVFGKGTKTMLDGKMYFIYNLKTAPKERLLLQLDSMQDYLVGVRLTSLPLDDEEADKAMYNDTAELDDNILNHNNIDTSAVITNKNPVPAIKIKVAAAKSW
ncbi:hypothetical protein [Pectinatus sottacetonis]|uniref:hypothetical protein n=1 Tax=Pectinatus sottacetonis TaxID=1002795 RepID=UPI0018C7AD89|nr:hypothetical protein [Pectinatus sottacetonis]